MARSLREDPTVPVSDAALSAPPPVLRRPRTRQRSGWDPPRSAGEGPVQGRDGIAVSALAVACRAEGQAVVGRGVGYRIERDEGRRTRQPHTVRTFKAHAGRITAIALGPSGLLASAGEDGSLKLWTLHPQRIGRALDGGQVQSLGFSRDGRRLIAGGKDGVIRVWSVKMPPLPGAT